MKHRVTVRELLRGDRLLGSGMLVLSNPVSGARTPAGKLEVAVRYDNRRETVRTWNAGTTMTIERPS